MIIDTSAVVAVLFQEPELDEFSDIIEAADKRFICAVNWYERSIVVRRRKGASALAVLERFRQVAELRVLPFGETHAAIAVEAYDRFGKGLHPAALNFADCCAYALAKAEGMPLLFKGDDFSRTDIPSACELWRAGKR